MTQRLGTDILGIGMLPDWAQIVVWSLLSALFGPVLVVAFRPHRMLGARTARGGTLTLMVCWAAGTALAGLLHIGVARPITEASPVDGAARRALLQSLIYTLPAVAVGIAAGAGIGLARRMSRHAIVLGAWVALAFVITTLAFHLLWWAVWPYLKSSAPAAIRPWEFASKFLWNLVNGATLGLMLRHESRAAPA